MTNLWLKEMPRHTNSEAEKSVFEALKTGLPKGWHAWHSLRLRNRNTGQFDETDFVVADTGKPALLLLEVKGGQIEMRDGRWHQNGNKGGMLRHTDSEAKKKVYDALKARLPKMNHRDTVNSGKKT